MAAAEQAVYVTGGEGFYLLKRQQPDINDELIGLGHLRISTNLYLPVARRIARRIGPLHLEKQLDGMKRRVDKFTDTNQPSNVNNQAGFLPYFPLKGCSGRFAKLDSAPRRRPELG